jgi:hypothetical protein
MRSKSMLTAESGFPTFRVLMLLECPVPLIEENMRGKYWLTQPFNIGKHEQIMQVFTSRELQMAAIGTS